MYNVCIVGGGAAGMTAAITIAMENPNLNIVIIEKKDKLGSKLYATGNGKCNISNAMCGTFGETSKFFRKLGVEIKVDDNKRAYPVSEQAKDIVFALEEAIKVYKINIVTNNKVSSIIKENDGLFRIKTDNKIIKAEKVILATGGKSAPQFGTTGDGFTIARKMGYKVTKLAPVLVPVECTNQIIGNITGVRAKGMVTLYSHQHGYDYPIDEQIGEIQFTKDGLSGICVFNLSRHIKLSTDTKFEDYYIEIDLLHRYGYMEIFHILSMRREIKDFKTENLMNSIVHREISSKVLKKWSSEHPMARDLTDEDLDDIIREFRSITYEVTGAKGWREAQCTAGGIDFEEFDIDTMESLKHPGMYFAGEVIDYDGPCGGYNLENAWRTGRMAGKAICTEYMK